MQANRRPDESTPDEPMFRYRSTARASHRRHHCLDAEKRARQTRLHDDVPHLERLVVEADAEVGPGVVAEEC